MAVVEPRVHAQRAIEHGVGHAAAGAPRGARTALGGELQGARPVVHERAPPARGCLPGPRLEELVARGERQDVDRNQAFQLRAGAIAVMPEGGVEELDLRARHVAFVRVEDVVIGGAQAQLAEVAPGLGAGADREAR